MEDSKHMLELGAWGGYSAPESIEIKLYPLDPLCQSQFRGNGKIDIYIEESLDWDEE